MKPVDFEYERPASLDQALSLLGLDGVFAKPIAGSQSLGPMLNMRLAQPDLLVDITSIEELVAVSDTADMVELGACVTHADIEDGRVPDPTGGLLGFVAGNIAYRAVRNRGTIGGSLAHADPAADWISALPLLGAKVVIRSPRGERIVAVEEIMVSSFVTGLEDDELIVAIRVPKLSKSARWGFYKFNQKVGEFAHAIGAVLYDPGRDLFRAVIGAIETAPIVIADASEIFGEKFNSQSAERMNRENVLSRLDEKGLHDAHSRKLLMVCLERAAKEAAGR